MTTITPGHKYIAANFENPSNGQTIQFIEKRPEGESLVTINDGTTNEELLAILIDRLNFLQTKFPCRENAIAITHIETGLLWLNRRTQNRVARGVEGTHKA